MSGLPAVFQGLYPSSVQGKRDAWHAPVLHNLYFYNHLMEEIRDAIEAGRYEEYKKAKLEGMEAGED